MREGREALREGNTVSANLHIGLIHYPVYDRRGRVICTAVTNLDIHDMARCTETFGLQMAYIVNPLDSQRELVNRIAYHWTEGTGARHNPTRSRAFNRIRVRTTIEEVVQEISEAHRVPAKTIATDAKPQDRTISHGLMRTLLNVSPQPYLLLLGTGWGLTQQVLEKSDYVLEPIEGVFDYNHLSVRSAMAITLDRLMGNR
jgi:hypothetical protein